MQVHVLAGLPRSGTTLLANVLSQHPDVYVSGTSALPLCVEQVVNVLSNAPEVQSDLANVPGAYEHYLAAMRGLIEGWYADRPESVIIDKGRGWAMYRDLLGQLYPDARILFGVRDPRDVIASIEREDRKSAAFISPTARTLYETADLLMRKDGMVGGPMRFAEDLMRRRNGEGVTWTFYESLVTNPQKVMERIERDCQLEPFDWDFDNVVNVATDLDALYRGKFPHKGSGKISPDQASWRDTLSPEIASLVAGAYPYFMRTFGYDT